MPHVVMVTVEAPGGPVTVALAAFRYKVDAQGAMFAVQYEAVKTALETAVSTDRVQTRSCASAHAQLACKWYADVYYMRSADLPAGIYFIYQSADDCANVVAERSLAFLTGLSDGSLTLDAARAFVLGPGDEGRVDVHRCALVEPWSTHKIYELVHCVTSMLTAPV